MAKLVTTEVQVYLTKFDVPFSGQLVYDVVIAVAAVTAAGAPAPVRGASGYGNRVVNACQQCVRLRGQ
jgi:hypothetical protein